MLSIFHSNILGDLFALLTLITFIYIFNFYFKYFTRLNPLPGPFPLPFIGALYTKRGHLSDTKAWMKWLNESYGDLFELYIANNRVIHICKAEYVDKLFISKDNKFPHRFGHSEGLKELGYNDIGLLANANLEGWKSSRLFFNSMFLPSYSEKTYDAANKLWKEMESNWLSNYNNSKNGFEIDMAEWIRRFDACMIFDLNLGIKMSLMQDNKKLFSMLDMFVTSFEWFIVHPYWMRHYVPPIRAHTKRLLKNKDDLVDVALKIIRERRKEIENSLISKDGNAEKMKDMLSMMIMSNTSLIVDNLTDDLSPELKQSMTEREILGNVLDSVFGGTSTTTSMFIHIVHMLTKYPNVVNRFRQELDSVFGEDHERPFTAQDLSKLKYCDAIINEVVRLNHVLKLSARVSTEREEVAGYTWPAGTAFHINFERIHLNKSHWKDPEVFNPDRFMNNDNKPKNSLIQFGGGTRMCPGRKYATIMLKGMMTMLYRKYNVELVCEEDIAYHRDYLFAFYNNFITKLTPIHNQIS
ncbi:cytochrome P450 [Gigaspora margarita]|uniref:Cytochrome P450 n=1 Tax=Gigaspora margarita TaxID=4874 RepID=A0A8H4B479_GIGMA|nr:cytochrome P450 [Gigaspora margarita]KAF0557936.1 cytochrome P450 [Gigaspora margarita]